MTYVGSVLFFGVFVMIRFVIYWSKLNSMKRYFRIYEEYLANPSLEFLQDKSQIIALFKEADIANFYIHRLEPAGFGQVMKQQIDGFQNIALTDGEIIHLVRLKFNEAIGVFRHRMKESINPLFWIEFAFKLPQYLFKFVGVLPENIVVKIVLIIYWLALTAFGLKQFDLLSLLFK